MSNYSDSFIQFIKENSWEDNTGAYNCELIKVEDVLNAWNHYTDYINQDINNISNCIDMINNNLYDIEDVITE